MPNRYVPEEINTENPYIDNLVYYTKLLSLGTVLKNSQEAFNNETVNSLKSSDIFIHCKEETALLEYFDSIPAFIIRNTFISINDEQAVIYSYNKSQLKYDILNRKIPLDQYNDDPKLALNTLIKNIQENYINTYEEENNYYRMIIGLPPFIGTAKNIEYDPSIDDVLGNFSYLFPTGINFSTVELETPIYNLSPSIISVLESNGILDDIYESDEDLKYDRRYMKYISKKIDLYKARKADRFTPLYVPDVDSSILTDLGKIRDVYIDRLNNKKSYVLKTIYSEAYEYGSEYYDAFISILIIILAVNDVINRSAEFIATKDLFDWRTIKYIFESYGVKYIEDMPIKYQVNLAKNIQTILKEKSTTKCMKDLCDIFGLENIVIYRYYMIKRRKLDAYGNYITSIDEEGKHILEDEYDISFLRVPIDDDIENYISDETAYYTYEAITEDDPFWEKEIQYGEEDIIKKSILEKDFNYVFSKYISLDVYKQLEKASSMQSYIFNILYDRLKLEEYLKLKIPYIDNSNLFKLSDVFTFLTILTHLYYDTLDQIMDTPSDILFINGFNFEANKEYLKSVVSDTLGGNITNDAYIYSMNAINAFIVPDNIVDIKNLLNVYDTNISIRDSLMDRMKNANNYDEYICYKTLYDTLMEVKYTSEFFKNSVTEDIIINVPTNSISISSSIYNIEDYQNRMTIYVDGAKVSESEYIINTENKLIIFNNPFIITDEKPQYIVQINVYTNLFIDPDEGCATYTEYIKHRDSILYNKIIQIENEYPLNRDPGHSAEYEEQLKARQAAINIIVDKVIDSLSAYSLDVTKYFYLFNGFSSSLQNIISTYIRKIIDFFKSYKVQIYTFKENYVINSKLESYIRPIDIMRYNSSSSFQDSIKPYDYFKLIHIYSESSEEGKIAKTDYRDFALSNIREILGFNYNRIFRWNELSMYFPDLNKNWKSIAYGDTIVENESGEKEYKHYYIIISNTKYIMVSEDYGITWNKIENFDDNEENKWNKIIFDPNPNIGFIVIGDNKAVYSRNGMNWFNPVSLPSYDYVKFDTLCSNGNRIISLSNYSTRTNAETYAIYSDNGGANWNTGSIDKGDLTDLDNLHITDIVYDGKKFIATVGNSNAILISEDGINWSSSRFASSIRLQKIVYGNDVFIAIDDEYKLYRSFDAIYWNEIILDTPVDVHDISFVNGIFIAEYGLLYSDDNGIIWKYSTNVLNKKLFNANYQNILISNNSFQNNDIYIIFEPQLNGTAYIRSSRNIRYGTPEYISVFRKPNKTKYGVGENIDTTGMIISINWSDEEKVNITQGFTISPTKTSINTKDFRIDYDDKSTYQDIDVVYNINKFIEFTANQNNSSITLNVTDLEHEEDYWYIVYSIDNGTTWNEYEYGTEIIIENIGDKVLFAGIDNENKINSENKYYTFDVNGSVSLSGNASGLIYQKDSITTDYCFYNLFKDCEGITSISNKLLPATILADSCYKDMFSGCTGLTDIPDSLLYSAVSLEDHCYEEMFEGCTGILEISENLIPAETLAEYCYAGMFKNCTNLNNIPEDLLVASELDIGCYSSMFEGCTAISYIPEYLLDAASELSDNCYENMFKGCTNILSLPANLLPSMELADSCYKGMFEDCSNLTSISNKLLPATELADNCYENMFKNCEKIKLSKTQSSQYINTFRIPSEGTGISGVDSMKNMFTGTGGTFTGTPDLNVSYYIAGFSNYAMFTANQANIKISLNEIGTWDDSWNIMYSIDDGDNWIAYRYGDEITVYNIGDKVLFAGYDNENKICTSSTYHQFNMSGSWSLDGNLSSLITQDENITIDYCFFNLFAGCNGLTEISDDILPASELSDSCYRGMFSGCENLTDIPEDLLPALSMEASCYEGMFTACTRIEEIPANLLIGTTLADSCYKNMFAGCTNIEELPKDFLQSITLADSCYYGMFKDCTNLNLIPNDLLPATTLVDNCYAYMFEGCINLGISDIAYGELFYPFTIPAEGGGTDAPGALNGMFDNSGKTFDEPININTTYYIKTVITKYTIFTANQTNSTIHLDEIGTWDDSWNIVYSVDNGVNWNTYTFGNVITLPNIEDKVLFAGYNNSNKLCTTNDYHKFVMTGNISLDGNLCGLLNQDIEDSVSDCCFYNLFNGCTSLTSISNTILPANTLATYCYYYMFSYCTGITSIPSNLLHATTLANNCYSNMFNGCTGITSIPERLLPVTTLANYCYQNMFINCAGITSIPNGLLPATTLATSCYSGMFYGCADITSIPEGLLHATALANYCYYSMFYGCTGITSIPSDLLPANTLAISCYGYMFQNCTGITSIPEGLLPATTLASYCYQYMFNGCTGITSIPEGLLPATTLANYCYSYMFYGCTGITSIPSGLLPAMSLANYCYYYMFRGCTGITSIPSGLLPATTLSSYCYAYMFQNCTSITSIPEGLLPANILATYCYQNMFRSCTGITSIPSGLLPATTLTNYCYSYMFYGCTGITSIPSGLLPAMSLANYCYQYMFAGCRGITSIPNGLLNATTLTNHCYENMFKDCIGITSIPSDLLPATILATYCYQYMFYSCSSLKVSDTQTGIYQKPFRIPYSGTGTDASNAMANMFSGTGGTFTGTPTINTTYYIGINITKYAIFASNQANSTIHLDEIGTWTDHWSIFYSTNNGTTWNTYTFGSVITLPNIGDKVLFAGYGNENKICDTNNYHKFVMTGKWSLNGNLCGLINQDIEDSVSDYCFYKLFDGCTNLTSIYSIILPATTLADSCYEQMFNGCVGITSIPSGLLPATTLARFCYGNMFYGCTGITSIPSNLLPANTLTTSCYEYMFYGCTGITSIPSGLLHATTLAGYCYQNMFQNCTGITSIPNGLLPATTLTTCCYQSMFKNCTSITSIPSNLLPANTLTANCYYQMFYGCTGITSIPNNLLPANTLATYCYTDMFYGCTGITSIPNGLLPATGLATYCYASMFQNCTGITSIPSGLLPATTLRNHCYEYMFRDCTGITSIPSDLLPATTLATYCYQYMFYSCSSLKVSDTQTGIYQKPFRIPYSGTGTDASNALANMFSGTGGTFKSTPTINTTYYTA